MLELLLALLAQAAAANVVLVTADGLRHQELFTGADARLLDDVGTSGIQTPERVRELYWRGNAHARREALMPFFWGTLAPKGIVLGERAIGSEAFLTNPHRNSYPGYSEILTGRVVPEITGNIDLQNPAETVLEIARRELGLPQTGVGAFTSWNHFPYIVESVPGSIFVNAGYQDLEASAPAARWSELQWRMRTPWDTVRHNTITEELALAYLEANRPRVLFIAFDETDEWAHAKRYDRTLDAIREFDAILERLWSRIQSLDDYRDRTALVITTDHGRGRTVRDWTHHGKDVEGAQETWIAIVGPGVPARGSIALAEPVYQNQVAATLLELLGIARSELGAGAGAPLPLR